MTPVRGSGASRACRPGSTPVGHRIVSDALARAGVQVHHADRAGFGSVRTPQLPPGEAVVREEVERPVAKLEAAGLASFGVGPDVLHHPVPAGVPSVRHSSLPASLLALK